MEETMNFEHTIAVLENFAEELAEVYMNKLVAHDHYASGELWKSVKPLPIVVVGGRVTVQLEMAWYWKIIEEGLKPSGFYKNPGNFGGVFKGIMNWLSVKPTLPTHNYNNKLPNGSKPKTRDDELKPIAAAIAHSILKKGTRGTHLLRESVEETVASFEEAIREAISQDVDNNLNVALGYFTGNLIA